MLKSLPNTNTNVTIRSQLFEHRIIRSPLASHVSKENQIPASGTHVKNPSYPCVPNGGKDNRRQFKVLNAKLAKQIYQIIIWFQLMIDWLLLPESDLKLDISDIIYVMICLIYLNGLLLPESCLRLGKAFCFALRRRGLYGTLGQLHHNSSDYLAWL